MRVIQIPIFRALRAGESLDKVIEAGKDYPVRTSFAMFKLKRSIDQVFEFIAGTMKRLCGPDVDLSNMNDKEKELYRNLSISKICLTLDDDLKLDDFKDGEVDLSVKDVENLAELFK